MNLRKTVAIVLCLAPLAAWCADAITLSGQVVTASGKPVKDARVVAYYWRSCVANEIAGQTNTDSKGAFTVSFTNQTSGLLIVARAKDDLFAGEFFGAIASSPASTNGVVITVKGQHDQASRNKLKPGKLSEPSVVPALKGMHQ